MSYYLRATYREKEGLLLKSVGKRTVWHDEKKRSKRLQFAFREKPHLPPWIKERDAALN